MADHAGGIVHIAYGTFAWVGGSEVGLRLLGASFTDRKLTARDIAVDLHGDSAYVEFYWHYSAKQKSDGKDVQTDGRESQLYRRVDGGRWALVHVHYSGMPITP